MIAGYIYKADIYCPTCAMETYAKAHNTLIVDPPESFFDQQANLAGVDREEETSFDSDEFPKMVFTWDASNQDTCGKCGKSL